MGVEPSDERSRCPPRVPHPVQWLVGGEPIAHRPGLRDLQPAVAQQSDPRVVGRTATRGAAEPAGLVDREAGHGREDPLQLRARCGVDGRAVAPELPGVEDPVAGRHGKRRGREHHPERAAARAPRDAAGVGPVGRGIGPEPAVDLRPEDPDRSVLGLQRAGERPHRREHGRLVPVAMGRPELRGVVGRDLAQQRRAVGGPAGCAVHRNSSHRSPSVRTWTAAGRPRFHSGRTGTAHRRHSRAREAGEHVRDDWSRAAAGRRRRAPGARGRRRADPVGPVGDGGAVRGLGGACGGGRELGGAGGAGAARCGPGWWRRCCCCSPWRPRCSPSSPP